MALSAEVFGDSVRLLGKFLDEDGNPGFVIQQNFVHGDPERPNPTATEISEYLDTLGFQPVPGKPGRFLNDDEGVEIDDTHPGNFIRSKDGSLHPIDLMIRRTATPGLRRKIQSSLDDATPHPGVWTDITNYGRAIFGKGMDFVDWSVRMVKDLGKKITPYLRRIFHAINGGPWNDPKRIRAGIDARSLSRPETDKAVDQETKLNKSMAEWKRQGVQASIREEAAASRAGALREKLDHTKPGTPLDESLFREIADFGRLVFRQGMDYLDWSMRMVRDLGAKVTAHLPHLWRSIQSAAGNAASRLRAGAKPSYVVRNGALMSFDEGHPDAPVLLSPPPENHLPPETADHWRSLYKPGMAYLDWAGLAMAGQPASHASNLTAIWNQLTGTDHVVPAESFAEAKTRLDALVSEWQRLKNHEASLKTQSSDPNDWNLFAVRARLGAIAYEISQIISVPHSEKPKITIQIRSLPDHMHATIGLGQQIVEKFVSSKLGEFIIVALLNKEKNTFKRFENRISIMYLLPNVNPGVVAHEIAHDIEARHPEIKEAARAFLIKRKAEGDTVPLWTLTEKPEDTDDVHLDKWEERGGERYTGRDYPNGHTEILTKGIQRLARDPADFYARDPEHFEFVVRTFRGW